MPHVAARVLLAEPAGEERPRPPHQAQRRRTPRHSIVGQLGTGRRAAGSAARSHVYGAGSARLPRCVVAWRACCSSSPPCAWRWRPVAGTCSASRSTPPAAASSPAWSCGTTASAPRSRRPPAQATAATLGVPVEQVQAPVDGYARTAQGAELMRQIVTRRPRQADRRARRAGADHRPPSSSSSPATSASAACRPSSCRSRRSAVLDTIAPRPALGRADRRHRRRRRPRCSASSPTPARPTPCSASGCSASSPASSTAVARLRSCRCRWCRA